MDMPLVWVPCDKGKCYMGHAVKDKCDSLSQLQMLHYFQSMKLTFRDQHGIFSTVLSNSSKDFHSFS